MRKTTKALIGLGLLAAAPAVVNYVIQQRAASRRPARNNDTLYDWEYGKIHYSVNGENNSNGTPIVLVHGIYPGANSKEYDMVIDTLALDNKVYALDLLGFGYSDKPHFSYSSYLYVRLIKNFLEDVVGRPAVVVASLHSAAAAASCASLNPELFKKLVLVSPTGINDEGENDAQADAMKKRVFEAPVVGTSFYNMLCSKKGLRSFYEGLNLFPGISDAELDKFYLAAHDRGGKYPIAAYMGKFFCLDTERILENLDVDYQIILGEHPPVNEVFEIWSYNPEGLKELGGITIENAGMLPHFCAPLEFIEACGKL